jgi:hypothetical protein
MTLIIGLAARKGGGKNTIGDFLVRNAEELFGREPLPTAYDTQVLGRTHPRTVDARTYAYADLLKQLCQDLFGLTPEQCNGTNDQKNTPSGVLWENLPHYNSSDWAKSHMPLPVEVYQDTEFDCRPKGVMTARAVLQHFGTEVVRRMNQNAWCDALINRIRREAPDVAVVTDVRFPNECDAIKAAGGLAVRLTRAPFAGSDEHESERALDGYGGFDFVLDNATMTVDGANRAVARFLQAKGYAK